MPYCRNCGNEVSTGMRYCPKCGTELPTPKTNHLNSVIKRDHPSKNTSGQGSLAVVPPEIKGWNWGAFFLNWIWGIRNKTYIAFLCFIPFVNWVMPFVLGAKGSKWSWQNHKWESIDQFKKSQRKWSIWGLVIFVVGLSIALSAGLWTYFFPFI